MTIRKIQVTIYLQKRCDEILNFEILSLMHWKYKFEKSIIEPTVCLSSVNKMRKIQSKQMNNRSGRGIRGREGQ